jgi:UDP-N-acetylmuramate dehydrogenase
MLIFENHPLLTLNSFAIDAKAKYFTSIQSIDEIAEVVKKNKKDLNEQLLFLGGGSNLLFTKDFNGWVIKNDLKGIELIKEDENYFYVKAMAGENWHQFVMYCVDHNYAGVENLSLIPGNIGASPMQNIGAYGVEIKDVFCELEAYNIEDQQLVTFNKSDCEFGYRDSVFKTRLKNKFIITSVCFQLPKRPKYNTKYGAIEKELELMNITTPTIQAISNAVIQIRQSKLPDPLKIGNAGSFFKNPVISQAKFDALKLTFPNIPSFPNNHLIKVPAGWLIEQCGWKGYRKKDAGCYTLQALVLVNYGKATGAEIVELSQEIIESVKDKFGIELEREVNIF